MMLWLVCDTTAQRCPEGHYVLQRRHQESPSALIRLHLKSFSSLVQVKHTLCSGTQTRCELAVRHLSFFQLPASSFKLNCISGDHGEKWLGYLYVMIDSSNAKIIISRSVLPFQKLLLLTAHCRSMPSCKHFVSCWTKTNLCTWLPKVAQGISETSLHFTICMRRSVKSARRLTQRPK